MSENKESNPTYCAKIQQGKNGMSRL